jgi:hypothetical protein
VERLTAKLARILTLVENRHTRNEYRRYRPLLANCSRLVDTRDVLTFPQILTQSFVELKLAGRQRKALSVDLAAAEEGAPFAAVTLRFARRIITRASKFI